MESEATKRCARCKDDKPLGAFAWRGDKKQQPYCRACQAVYHREHYLKNKKRYMASAKRRMERMLEIIRQAKRRPCADCGVTYPYYVMDFDHRDEEIKTEVLNELRYESEDTIRAEIAKCDVVCANCHRERTHQRKQSRPKKHRSKPTEN
jgi:hypothetical protein